MNRTTGSRSETYAPPTPPGTPHKERKHSSLIDIQELHNRYKNSQLFPPYAATKRLSPLLIDTSYGNNPQWRDLSHRDTLGTDTNRGTVEPERYRNVINPEGYSMSEEAERNIPTYRSPASPGIFIQTHRQPNEQEKAFLSNVAFHLLTKGDEKSIDSGSLVQQPEPFPLEDPAKFRFKRQISTDSNDSSDIRFSHKGPTKRLMTRNDVQMPSVNTESTDILFSNKNTTKRVTEQKDSQVDQKQGNQGLHVKIMSEEDKERKISPRPYSATVKWVLNPDDPHPEHEEDFIPASDVLKDDKEKLKEVNESSNLITSTPKTTGRSDSNFSKDFHQEMMSGVGGRAIELCTTGNTSIRSNTVTEKGFVFPKQPFPTEPVPFSPRIVGNTPPHFKANKSKDNQQESLNRMLATRRNSLEDLSDDSVFESNSSASNNAIDNHILGKFLRTNALRSNSDIERSPSKAEIDEIRRQLVELHRSLSDPTFTPPRQKAMLQEERLLNDFPQRRDILENESLIEGYEYASEQAMTNVELRRMNLLLKEQYECMKKQHAKRQLFSPHYQSPPGSEDYWRRSATYQCEEQNPEEVARNILEELRKMSSARQSSQQFDFHLDDRVDGLPPTGTVCSSAYCRHKTDMGNTLERNQNQPQPFFPPASPRLPATLPSPRHGASAPSPRPSTSTGLISTSPWTPGTTRKRKRGDMEMRITCQTIAEESDLITEQLRNLEHPPSKNCKCASVEQEILQMAFDAYAKIRQTDDSSKSSQRYREEMNQTNCTILDAMKILSCVKTICKHGRSIEDIFPGSVVISLSCPTVTSLDDLWEMYMSGDLCALVNDGFLTESVKKKFDAYDVELSVYLSKEQFLKSRKRLVEACRFESSFSKSDSEIIGIGSDSKENLSSPYRRKTMKSLAVVHMRSSSEPTKQLRSPSNSPNYILSPRSPRDRKFSFSLLTSEEKSPRRAFQEIQIPASPTLRKVFNFDIALNSNTSPKRKSFAEIPPWESDSSTSQEVSSPKRVNYGKNGSLFKYDKSSDQ